MHLDLCARFASMHLDLERSSYCGRIWSRLSCVLQREIVGEIDRTAHARAEVPQVGGGRR